MGQKFTLPHNAGLLGQQESRGSLIPSAKPFGLVAFCLPLKGKELAGFNGGETARGKTDFSTGPLK